MSDIHEAIQAALTNGEVPARVSNRLLLAVILELAQRQDKTDEAIRELAQRLASVEHFPSILALLWRRPLATVSVICVIFVLLVLAYQAGTLPLF